MSVLIWLIPLALAMGGLGLAGFLWSLKSGQFEDLDGAAARILIDDDKPLPSRPKPKPRPQAADTEDEADDDEDDGEGAKSL